MPAQISDAARFVHLRADEARTAAARLAREVGSGRAKAVADRQHLLLNAIEELTVEHGREVEGCCVVCGQPHPCTTLKRCVSVWSADRAFDESWGINNHRP